MSLLLDGFLMERNIEKRMLIAIVLTLGLLMLWRAFLAPPPPPPLPHAKSVPTAKAGPVGPSPSASATPLPPPRVALPVMGGTKAQDVVVENSLYRITFSTQGAVVKSWVLKKYQDAQNKPLDVVSRRACAQLGYPMSIILQDAALAAKVNSAVYVVSPTSAAISAPRQVTFTYSNGQIEVKKRYFFDAGYEAKVRVSVFDGRHDLPVSVTWPGGVGDQSLPAAMKDATSLAFYDQGNGISTVAEKKVKGGRVVAGPLAFAGLEDNFFAGVFLPDSPQEFFAVHGQALKLQASKKNPPEALTAVLGMSQAKPLAFRLFIAPKDLGVLQAASPALTGLVKFGLFSFFAKPLFLGMRWVHHHVVHNWGWAIVIVTVIINMVFFPLKLKSIRSAQAMQRVAPIVKEIQDRYKQYKFNDPRKQRMQQEMMKVYQEHGVNPIGGCLPMLAQLPIIYGFYEVLETSIAFRHAPWILWVKDLSAPDHLYLLPGLAVVLSFIMQAMTPMPSVDPAQRRMMMIAPLALGFIFFRLAAGVTLYYFVYSAVAIAQQLVINRMAPPKASLPAPPASGKSQAARPRKAVPVKG